MVFPCFLFSPFKCPLDMQEDNNWFLDSGKKREILSLKIKCKNVSDGCPWQNELREQEVYVLLVQYSVFGKILHHPFVHIFNNFGNEFFLIYIKWQILVDFHQTLVEVSENLDPLKWKLLIFVVFKTSITLFSFTTPLSQRSGVRTSKPVGIE